MAESIGCNDVLGGGSGGLNEMAGGRQFGKAEGAGVDSWIGFVGGHWGEVVADGFVDRFQVTGRMLSICKNWKFRSRNSISLLGKGHDLGQMFTGSDEYTPPSLSPG